MEIPEIFLEDLKVEFQDRLRAKFSRKQNATLIQQRMARNVIGSLNRKFLKHDDERRQHLAEGYKTIMTVAASETIRCPECCMKLEVPKLETRQIKCLYCKLKGRKTQVTSGYYPLNSSLINHLKAIDPMRNMDNNLVQATMDQNERIAKQQQKQLYDNAHDYASDNLNRLMGIPVVGYAGTKLKEGTQVKGF